RPLRDSPPARRASVQPSRGCIPDHLFRGVRGVRGGRQSFLTEHSVNTATLAWRDAQDQACNGSRIGGRRQHPHVPAGTPLTQPLVPGPAARAKTTKFSIRRSMSASSCCTEISHCSILPQGGRKTPPLCW